MKIVLMLIGIIYSLLLMIVFPAIPGILIAYFKKTRAIILSFFTGGLLYLCLFVFLIFHPQLIITNFPSISDEKNSNIFLNEFICDLKLSTHYIIFGGSVSKIANSVVNNVPVRDLKESKDYKFYFFIINFVLWGFWSALFNHNYNKKWNQYSHLDVSNF